MAVIPRWRCAVWITKSAFSNWGMGRPLGPTAMLDRNAKTNHSPGRDP